MNIAWFIFIAFIVIGIQGYIYSKWGLARIHYSRYFSEKAVFEGEKVEMVDEISNRKLLPVPWLRLESKINANLQFEKQSNLDNEIDSGEYHRTLFSLMPYQKVRRRQSVTCTKRGYYRFETVSLTAGDAFGIGESFKSVESAAEITVYPKLVAMEDIPLPTHSWLGDIIVRRWIMEDPFLTAGAREYSYGDPMNAINWKATARTSQLQVSKKDFSADHHLMIYINFNQTNDIWLPIIDGDALEKALSYAASIAQYTIANGISTGFGCNAYTNEKKKTPIRIEPESSKQQLMHIFETIARTQIATSTYFDYFLRDDIEQHRQGTDILLIATYVSDDTKKLLKQLEDNGNSVEILMLDVDAKYEQAM